MDGCGPDTIAMPAAVEFESWCRHETGGEQCWATNQTDRYFRAGYWLVGIANRSVWRGGGRARSDML